MKPFFSLRLHTRWPWYIGAPIVMLLVVITIYTVQTAEAVHPTGERPVYAFLGEDIKRQSTGAGDDYPENYVYREWMTSNPVVFYVAHNGNTDFLNKVTEAVNNWQAAIPDTNFEWFETLDEDAADVTFRYQNMGTVPCDAAGAATPALHWVETWEADSLREARYVKLAHICIDTLVTDPNDMLKYLIHEIGHSYGLHERYIRLVNDQDQIIGSRCNGYERSVMDGFGCNSATAPTTLDKQRAESFKDGYPGAWGHTGSLAKGEADKPYIRQRPPPDNSRLGVAWGDEAWVETSHRYSLQLWDGAQWNELDWGYHDPDVGAHVQQGGLPMQTLIPTFPLVCYTANGTLPLCPVLSMAAGTGSV